MPAIRWRPINLELEPELELVIEACWPSLTCRSPVGSLRVAESQLLPFYLFRLSRLTPLNSDPVTVIIFRLLMSRPVFSTI